MRHSKFIFSALAVTATIGFATPAAALPTFTGPYQVVTGGLDCANTGTGSACVPQTHIDLKNTFLGLNHNVAYAGPLEVAVTLKPVNVNPTTDLIVFCDDLAKNIATNHIYGNYFISDPSNPTDVVNYLNVGSLAVAHEIMGLTAEGTFQDINGTLTPELGAAFQLAIWELEYGGTATFSGDANFQTLIDGLIANATADYNFFTNTSIWLKPWTFLQLESPCNRANVGLVTKDPPQSAHIGEAVNPNCQNEQGLIAAIPGTRQENVPEPISLSLFGAGLAVVAAYRRRRKNEV
jgi:hypothetical protein